MGEAKTEESGYSVSGNDFSNQKRRFTKPFKIGGNTYQPGVEFICKENKNPGCYDLYLLDGTGIIRDVESYYLDKNTELVESL